MGGGRSRRTLRPRHGRWIGAVAVLALFGFLYYRPVQAYLRAQEQLDQRTYEVRHLATEHRKLARRLVLDEKGATLVQEARRLGLVRSGEQLFIVKGIGAWRKARAGSSEK